MNSRSNDKKIKCSKKLKVIEKQFEEVRRELNQQVRANEKLSDQKNILELSKKLDIIHNEYIKIKNI